MPHPDKEGLLSRWSRLKRERSAADADDPSTTEPGQRGEESLPDGGEVRTPSETGGEPLVELPSLDDLTPDSDFRAFMDPRVDDGVRRAALKTLFRSSEFNVTDGLDVYAEDYSKLEKLTPAMVAALKYAQRRLFGEREGEDEAEAGVSLDDRADGMDPERTRGDEGSSAGGQSDPVEREASDSERTGEIEVNQAPAEPVSDVSSGLDAPSTTNSGEDHRG